MGDYQDNRDNSGQSQYGDGYPDRWKACEQTPARADTSSADPEKKRRRIIPGIFFGAAGILLIAAGLFLIFSAGLPGRRETEEAVDVYLAREKDQYVFVPVQYMTESIAYYEAMDKLQIYIALDEEWNPAVVCVHDEERELIQPYIDYLYSDEYGNPPQMLELRGYAQPFDRELQKMVMEGFDEVFGEGYMDEGSFEEWFGSYYVQTGRKNSDYGISNTGFYLCLAGIAAVIVCGIFLYKKQLRAASRLLGVLGALLGALLGGFLWAVVMAWGYVSGWLGILIIVFAHTGYVIGSGRQDIFGRIVSILLGVLVVIPSTYLAEGWGYYQMVNESVSGYTSFARALVELPHFMDQFGMWKDFQINLITGYGYMAIAAVYYIASFFFNSYHSGKKNKGGTGQGGLGLHQINERSREYLENENEQNLK